MRLIFELLVVMCSLAAVRSFYFYNLEDIMPRLHICNHHKEDRLECIKRTIESVRFYLETGIPRLKIPSFVPYCSELLKFRDVEILQGSATFTNITIYGITNYVINEVEVQNFVKFHENFVVTVQFPFIRLTSLYDINATIDNISIQQSGLEMYADFWDLIADITIGGRYFQEYGKNVFNEHRFQVYTVDVEFEVNRFETYVELNIDHTKPLSNDMKTIFKNSLKLLAEDRRGLLKKAVSKVILENVNKFLNVPASVVATNVAANLKRMMS